MAVYPSHDVDASGRPALGLRQYLDVLRRRKWIVIGIAVLAVGVALGISYAQKKKYEATTKIVVGQGNGLIPSAYSNAVQPYTATMADLVRSNVVAQTVISQLGLHESPTALLNQVSVSINPSTAVMTVNVVDTSTTRAVTIAQHVATVFAGLVRRRFGSKPTPIGGGAVQLPLTATVFDPAHADPGAVSPKPKRNGAIALALGIALGLIAAFLREHFDRGLRTREAVEQSFGVPVIGQVPFVRVRKGNARPVAWDGRGEVAEAFRAVRANLQYLGVRRPLRTILVTSAAPEQGKTTVTANLAVAIARSGSATAVIEGDLRRPRLDTAFDVNRTIGLTNVLVGSASADEALVDLSIPGGGAGRIGQLSFLPSGPLPPNPSELLSSAQMTALLERLGVVYDHVLIDSPPLLAVADGIELARMVDGVLLVVRRNSATTEEAREVRSLVDALGIHLVGTVYTDVPAPAAYYGEYGAASAAPALAAARDDPA